MNRGKSKSQIMTCKVCGSNAKYAATISSDVDDPECLDMYACPKCGLVFVHNPLNENEMAEFYARIDREKWFHDSASFVDKKNKMVARLIQSLKGDCSKISSLLDVGCGDGHLLEVIRESYPLIQGEGYELPGCEEAAVAKGLSVYTCPVSQIPKHYDFATMVDVIEHVPDPAGIIRDIGSIVKPGGRLIIYTPRRCFIDTMLLAIGRLGFTRRMLPKWFSTRLSIWHVQISSAGSLRYSLSAAGFTVEKTQYLSSFSAPVDYFLKRMRCPKWAMGTVKFFVELVFEKMGLLKTKVLCIAIKN